VRIHYFQHVPFEGLGAIENWGRSHHHQFGATRFYHHDPLPDLNAIDWLVVMGGPMSVHDEDQYPWLTDEKRFIEEAISREKVVVGICLGAQLIADVLGARVYPNQEKEIGWFPIALTEMGRHSQLFDFLPKKLKVFHWHGETFDLPRDAVHIASSEGCRHQAFTYRERILGLQFHLESTPESVEDLLQNSRGELREGRCIQNPEQIRGRPEDFEGINRAMSDILRRLQRQEGEPWSQK
jgi:GMP synthase (glutamine-hydrolysing)